jgi:hypothetical protein
MLQQRAAHGAIVGLPFGGRVFDVSEEEGKGAKAPGAGGGVSNIRLAGEATKDLVIFYAEAGDPKNARPYFEDIVGGAKVFPMMEALAYHYADIGNRTAARDVFKALIAEKPL